MKSRKEERTSLGLLSALEKRKPRMFTPAQAFARKRRYPVKRRARPVVSAQGEQFLCVYEQRLRTHQDLTAMSIRTSLSDLRHVVAWYEQKSTGEQEEERTLAPTTCGIALAIVWQRLSPSTA
jgi:hypothetical protein